MFPSEFCTIPDYSCKCTIVNNIWNSQIDLNLHIFSCPETLEDKSKQMMIKYTKWDFFSNWRHITKITVVFSNRFYNILKFSSLLNFCCSEWSGLEIYHGTIRIKFQKILQSHLCIIRNDIGNNCFGPIFFGDIILKYKPGPDVKDSPRNCSAIPPVQN